MTDFFAPLSSEVYGELLAAQVGMVKPANEMTKVEWAEYCVLDALVKAEHLKAALMFTRITGEHPTNG